MPEECLEIEWVRAWNHYHKELLLGLPGISLFAPFWHTRTTLNPPRGKAVYVSRRRLRLRKTESSSALPAEQTGYFCVYSTSSLLTNRKILTQQHTPWNSVGKPKESSPANGLEQEITHHLGISSEILKTFLCSRVNITAMDNVISKRKWGQNPATPPALSHFALGKTVHLRLGILKPGDSL